MHWKVGHFAAMVGQKKGRYQLKNSTFGSNSNLWVTAKALEAETDRYFLVPAGALPKGWHAVSQAEAQNVWGKGAASTRDGAQGPGTPNQCTDGNCCNAGGMAKASVYSMQTTLNIQDVPLSYSPPVGPVIAEHVNYNQLEGNQPDFHFHQFRSRLELELGFLPHAGRVSERHSKDKWRRI